MVTWKGRAGQGSWELGAAVRASLEAWAAGIAEGQGSAGCGWGSCSQCGSKSLARSTPVKMAPLLLPCAAPPLRARPRGLRAPGRGML